MRLIKGIPNTITSMNLLCGVLGVIFSLNGRLDIGFLLMMGAAVCDFCDGLAARLLKAYSDIGKELDSLADVVSFGVLPSVMLYQLSGTGITILRYVPLLMAAFSALRLANFNLDERQHESFIGLPTPAAAMICGSLAFFVSSSPHGILAVWCDGPVFIPVLSIVLCALLVCGVPMFAMKFGGGNKASATDNIKRIVFLAVVLASVIVTLITGSNWSLAALISFTGYVLINLAAFPFVASE